jgi:hypothetical protein
LYGLNLTYEFVGLLIFKNSEQKAEFLVQISELVCDVSQFKFPPVPLPRRDLAQIELDEFVIECADAVAHPYIDPAGTKALLGELDRRGVSGELDPQFVEVAQGALKVALAASVMNSMSLDEGKERAEQSAAIQSFSQRGRDEFLFHGTLVSRLLGISREGLIPRKRSKKWGRAAVDEHAATGVFFTKSWRSAFNWTGPSAIDAEGKPTKGAILRIPAEGLIVEPDRLSAAPGAFVVRQPSVPVSNAAIMLYPFTVTSPWIDLPTAVALTRRKRIHS